MSIQLFGNANSNLAEVEANTLAAKILRAPQDSGAQFAMGNLSLITSVTSAITTISAIPFWNWMHIGSKPAWVHEIKVMFSHGAAADTAGVVTANLFIVRDYGLPPFTEGAPIQHCIPVNISARTNNLAPWLQKLRTNKLSSIDYLGGSLIENVDFANTGVNRTGPVFTLNCTGNGTLASLFVQGLARPDPNPIGSVSYSFPAAVASGPLLQPVSIFKVDPGDHPIVLDPGMGLELQITRADLATGASFQTVIQTRWQEDSEY